MILRTLLARLFARAFRKTRTERTVEAQRRDIGKSLKGKIPDHLIRDVGGDP